MGKWLKIIGVASVFVFPLMVVLYRSGVVTFGAAFVLIKVGAVIGVLVFLLGLGCFLFTRNSNPSGAKAAIVGAIIAILPVVPLALQAKKGVSLPFIHNVSTDIEDAPKFDKIAGLRGEQDNPHEYDPNQIIREQKLGELQAAAYPNVKTHSSDLAVTEALEKAEAVAKSMGWEIVNVDPVKGLVEATETTLLWGFKDDIVIRVRQAGGKTEVDLHSVSRFGGSDLGANAARIQAFIERFQQS